MLVLLFVYIVCFYCLFYFLFILFVLIVCFIICIYCLFLLFILLFVYIVCFCCLFYYFFILFINLLALCVSDDRWKTVSHSPRVLHVIQDERGLVYGLATLGDELFVVSEKSPSVHVYRASDFVESRQISVPDMKYPVSLAACPHNNCLYVSDYQLKLIHRVDLSSSSVSKWSVGDTPWGLSVTRNHHLLVTLPSSKRIREYTTHGDVMREINLDVSIDSPLHSIELSSGQFVVCHTGAIEHRVCTVDTSGRIVQSYGGPKGSSAGQIDKPYCLAVDKRGYVLVADRYNDKVQILSPALTRLCDVTLPEHGLSFP